MRILSMMHLVIALGGISAYAQMQTVKEYRDLKDTIDKARLDPTARSDPRFPALAQTLDLYVKGVGDGFLWANAELQTSQHERLFCAPVEKLGLNAQNYEQLVGNFLPVFQKKMRWPMRTWKSVDDVPIAFVMLLALMDAFPCNKQTQQQSN